MQSLILIPSNPVFWVPIMVDIQTISVAIASADVLVAAIYYILQIRHQTTIRKTDLLIRLYQTYTRARDGIVNMRDIGIAVSNFGKHYP
jgi:hypothetical protein